MRKKKKVENPAKNAKKKKKKEMLNLMSRVLLKCFWFL